MHKFLIPFFALALLCSCTLQETEDGTNTAGYNSEPSSPSAMQDDEQLHDDTTDTSDTKDGIELVEERRVAQIQTSEGDITIEVFGDVAPKTATNFIRHAESGYYDELTFHRVIPGFMIQGGDPTGTGAGGESIYGDTFEDEINPSSDLYADGYSEGDVAMANRGPDTNGSQFFIMDADYPLPPNYTIFGRVTAGQEVVNAIANVERNSNDKPLEPVTFSVVVEE